MNRKIVIVLLLTPLITTNFVCINNRTTKNMLKFYNQSNKTIISILNTKQVNSTKQLTYIDTNVLKQKLYTRLKDNAFYLNDDFHFIFIKPRSTNLFFNTPYCNQEVWAKQVATDTLLLYILDKDIFSATHSISKAELKKVYITYDYLVKNNCTITYAE